MDTNIIGRGVDTAPMANRRSNVHAIYARSLTPGSHGNAVGIGLADVVSSRLVSQMDPRASYTNALSAMTPATVRISINFPSDAECLQAVLRVAGVPAESATILKIRNTLALEHIVASEACLPKLADNADVEPLGSPMDWPLDASGNFDTSADLLSGVHAS
jgi:hypothetical protein